MSVQSSLQTEETSHKQTLELTNKRGLHARASAKLARLAEAMEDPVWIIKDGQKVTACSIMGLMMLGAAFGDSIEILCEGPGAAENLKICADLVLDRFGEAE